MRPAPSFTALFNTGARRLSQEHEWVRIEGDIATVGITDHAQDQLGDVVFVDLPEVGATFEKDDTFGAVESVKAASDIYSPVTGEVTEVNDSLADEPSLVNSSAEGEGWMAKFKLAKPEELDGLMVRAALGREAPSWSYVPTSRPCAGPWRIPEVLRRRGALSGPSGAPGSRACGRPVTTRGANARTGDRRPELVG